MYMKIILFLIFILWLIQVSRDILFWTYLWQLKEYRRDRMLAHFELKSAKRVFFSKFFIGKVILFLSSAFSFIGIWKFFLQVLIGALYAALGLRSAYAIYEKKLKEPVFTKKAIAVLGISIAPLVLVAFLTLAKASSETFLVTILSLEIMAPLLVAGVVGLCKYPSDFFKNKIIQRAQQKRESLKNILVIGITGSYGKTSMKEFLAHILSGKLKVAKTTENHNSEIGVAKCVLTDLFQDTDIFIVEMGAYREGEIKKICEIVQPQIGILTGINEQHISLFGSQEKVVKAKYELIESLPRQGLGIFNGENDYTRALYEKTRLPKRMYSLRAFSVSAKPDIAAEKIDFTQNGMQFYVRLQNKKELFETKLLGRHNVLNILGATLVAHGLGMSLEEIKEQVKSLQPPPHTLEVKHGIRGAMIIDDSYSANPRGVAAALDVLNSMKGNKKILVMYPLIELGDGASDIHRRIGAQINKACDICILTSLDFSREIRKNAPNTDVFTITDPSLVIAKLEKNLKEGDIVLLENRIPDQIKTALVAAS